MRTTESNLRLDPAHSPMADTILKRYEIKDVLASGISVVYRAFDSHSGHDVAVKTVRVLSNEDSASRTLRNEGQILKRLHHQNVIDVHDFGEFKKGRETFSFIVMPLLHGHTLDQMIGAAAKLESAVVVDVISQTCQGLQHTHEQGIVHRNIRPKNIFVTTEQIVKIIDFGLARDLSNENQNVAAGKVIGTLLYMSPEQIQGLTATPASDIFCLGAVCYEALSGLIPFDGASLSEVLLAIMHRDPAPLVSVRPDLGNELSLAVQKALAKRMEERYSSADEFGEAIRCAACG